MRPIFLGDVLPLVWGEQLKIIGGDEQKTIYQGNRGEVPEEFKSYKVLAMSATGKNKIDILLSGM